MRLTYKNEKTWGEHSFEGKSKASALPTKINYDGVPIKFYEMDFRVPYDPKRSRDHSNKTAQSLDHSIVPAYKLVRTTILSF
jgi:hypothetical protein